jgi:hypothetical protein
MKVLKEVLFVSDDFTVERNKNGAIVFQKFLKKLLEDKREYSFLYAWQWFLSIARTNVHFRRKVKQFSGLF